MRKFTYLALALMVVVVLAGGSTVSARDTLIIAQGTDPVTLDAHHSTDSPTSTVTEHISETLFELTPEGEIVPLLAESFTVSEDGLTWQLNIRQGVYFHDGTPLNAEAVKFNIDRILDPDESVTFRFLLTEIVETSVVDEYTVEFVTEQPFAPILAHLTHTSISMQSPTAIQEYGEDYGDLASVGTGPFVFDSWQRGQEVALVRNENYWGDHPAYERLVFRAVPEGGARMMMVQSGDVDVAVRVPPHDISRLDADPNVNVMSTPSLRTIYIGFNVTMEPFTDPLVRQAVNYAVDKDAIVDFILAGVGQPVDAPVAPGVFGYQSIKRYDHDLDRARELLAEAGFPDGFETKLYSPSGRYMQDIQISEAVQSMLADVGIDAEIVTLEWSTYLEVTQNPPERSEAPMFMLGWGTVTGDADYGLYALFHTSEHVPDGSNRAFYSNARVDELLDQARTNPDDTFRQEAYLEAMQIIMDEAPWLFLHVEEQKTAVRSDVHGLVVHPAERIQAVGVTFE